MKSKASFTILAASVLIGSFASTSHAQEATVTTTTQAPAPTTAEQQTQLFRPNRPLLLAGGVSFLGGYVPAIFVAALSPHVGDNHLWIPLVGPWLDLGDRPMCGSGAGKTNCGIEVVNDGILILSGVAQAAGVAGIIAAFFIPEERKVQTVTGKAAPSKPFQIHLTPTTVGKGAPGLAAIGTW